MKFLVDMPITPQAVGLLRAAGHDAAHASEIGLAKVSDAAILEAARKDGRIIITADLDFPRLLAALRSASPGVILFRGGAFSDQEMLSLLGRVLEKGAALDLEHSITVVDRARVRRRKLPIGDE